MRPPSATDTSADGPGDGDRGARRDGDCGRDARGPDRTSLRRRAAGAGRTSSRLWKRSQREGQLGKKRSNLQGAPQEPARPVVQGLPAEEAVYGQASPGHRRRTCSSPTVTTARTSCPAKRPLDQSDYWNLRAGCAPTGRIRARATRSPGTYQRIWRPATDPTPWRVTRRPSCDSHTGHVSDPFQG